MDVVRKYFRVPSNMTTPKVLVDLGMLPSTTPKEIALASRSLTDLQNGYALLGYVDLNQSAEACERTRMAHNMPPAQFLIAKHHPEALAIQLHYRGTTQVEIVSFQPGPGGIEKALRRVIDDYFPVLNIGIGTNQHLLAVTTQSYRVISNRGPADNVQSQGSVNCDFAGSLTQCIGRAMSYANTLSSK